MTVTNYYTVDSEILGEKTAGGSRLDYLTDALGSVTATLNQSAQVVNTYRYKPYGGLLAKTGTEADPAFQWMGAAELRHANAKFADEYILEGTYSSIVGQWSTNTSVVTTLQEVRHGSRGTWFPPGDFSPPLLPSPTAPLPPSTLQSPRQSISQAGNGGNEKWPIDIVISVPPPPTPRPLPPPPINWPQPIKPNPYFPPYDPGRRPPSTPPVTPAPAKPVMPPMAGTLPDTSGIGKIVLGMACLDPTCLNCATNIGLFWLKTDQHDCYHGYTHCMLCCTLTRLSGKACAYDMQAAQDKIANKGKDISRDRFARCRVGIGVALNTGNSCHAGCSQAYPNQDNKDCKNLSKVYPISSHKLPNICGIP